ncbi:MAG: M12 family metallo-peptidase [Dokdonella sp.]
MRLLLQLFFAIALVTGSAAATAGNAATTLTWSTISNMANTPVGSSIEVSGFPAGPGVFSDMSFRRIDIYADHARIILVDAAGEHELPRSQRIHLLGYSPDGSIRVALSFDADLKGEPYGAGSAASGPFELRSERAADGWQLHAIKAEDALPPDVKLDFTANEDSLPNPFAATSPLDHLLDAQSPTGVLRNAVVAVDTDTTFMSKRFTGNTTQATAWIADLFTQMNLMYRRDLDVDLKQGTTYLRTASDPYANTDTSATGAMLDEFGNYWQANYSAGSGAVSRAFALLLSGNSGSGNSASGIAWINSYCRTNSYGGSYSVNQIFTNAGVGVASSAFIVGHELGHNFGASHTHCTEATSGLYPRAINTIDQCYSGEGGCYSGAVSCPTGTPDSPKGSAMSYCHVSSASCGQNVQKFDPTHITLLRGRVAANTPSCLTINTDLIFANGFQ